MGLSFSPKALTEIEKIVARYPNKMAATLPVLYLAQNEFGHISNEVIDLVAEILALAPSHIYGVATFYTMFHKKKAGTYHIQVCTNVSCMLCKSNNVLSAFEEALGIKVGETTQDGKYSLSEVECLAHCGTAPAVQVNDTIHERFNPEQVSDLLETLK